LYLRQEVWQDLFLGITRALLILIGLLLLERPLLLITIVLVGGTPAQLVLQQVLPGTHQLLCTRQTAAVLEEAEAQLFRLLLLNRLCGTAPQAYNVLVLETVLNNRILVIKQVQALATVFLVLITTLERIHLANLPRAPHVLETLDAVAKG
jgi:hypothetical protein